VEAGSGATLVGGPYFAEMDFIMSSAVSPSVETLIISDRDLIQLSVEEGEKNLLHAI